MRAWEEFLEKQVRELGKEIVDKWLRPLKPIRFDACNLYLEASDSFKALWFEEHMRVRVQKELFNNNQKKIRVHISVATSQEVKEKSETKGPKKKIVSLANSGFSLRFDDLDPDANFENYVVSHHSLLAFKMLHELSSLNKDPVSLHFNPIFLYGRSGTGKTHLMMAAAAALNQSGKKALYVRAQTFTEHVVDAIRTAEMQTFRKAYRNVDALLIDDIEIFSRKGATQEELFHTFNTLHVEGKQIILSSCLPPGDLKFIEPRLISRFEWGIVIPLQMPLKEHMENILKQRALKRQFPLEDDVKNFLLDTFGGSAKTLVRALDALILRMHLNQGLGKTATQLTVKQVQHTLKDLIQEEEKAILTPGKIIKTVAEYYGIPMDDILSKSQARECTLARQLAMHLCREQLNLPFMKIGDIFSRDHSTVITSVKQVQKGVEMKNYEISGPLNGILKLLER
jgi:chromosomal replication initiator protein